MEDLFDPILDRPRSRLDIPALRTLFGLKSGLGGSGRDRKRAGQVGGQARIGGRGRVPIAGSPSWISYSGIACSHRLLMAPHTVQLGRSVGYSQAEPLT
jgi:hypothetical protein